VTPSIVDPATTDPGGSSTPFSDPLTWINLGLAGVVIVLLLTGWLWAKPAVTALLAERDRLLEERNECRAQRDAMAELFQDKALPVLGEFLAVTKVLLPALQEVAKHQERPQSGRSRGGGDRGGGGGGAR